jgi:transposase
MQVYIGIDWSEKKHDVVFQNEAGVQLLRLTIAHNLGGFLQLDNAREQLGISPEEVVVGMETAHNLLIDFLWERGYTQIYVLPPRKSTAVRGASARVGRAATPRMPA